MNPTAALLALLRGAGIDALDGRPERAPAGLYVAVFDDAGLARTHRPATPAARHVKWTWRLVCVARTTDGLRDLVGRVRDTTSAVRLAPGADPLSEVVAGPVLDDGPTGDVRLSQTITLTTHTPRSTDG